MINLLAVDVEGCIFLILSNHVVILGYMWLMYYFVVVVSPVTLFLECCIPYTCIIFVMIFLAVGAHLCTERESLHRLMGLLLL